MENNYVLFILSNNRPNNIITLKTLNAYGFKGNYYIIIDNEDKHINEYQNLYGKEKIVIFDKKYYADNVDEGNNFDDRKCVIHARNACFDIAKNLGYENFLVLDDDYYYFGYRYDSGARKIKDLDSVFKKVFTFLNNTPTTTIAFSQGGDHIGGFSGIKLKRKAMNSFFCSTNKPFQFIGSMNEDVNTYVRLSELGHIFYTFTNLQLDQKDTQAQKGGMTTQYMNYGTYLKSMTSVLYSPSCVKVAMMNSTNQRLHHSVKWANTTPMIINEKYKKL